MATERCAAEWTTLTGTSGANRGLLLLGLAAALCLSLVACGMGEVGGETGDDNGNKVAGNLERATYSGNCAEGYVTHCVTVFNETDVQVTVNGESKLHLQETQWCTPCMPTVETVVNKAKDLGMLPAKLAGWLLMTLGEKIKAVCPSGVKVFKKNTQLGRCAEIKAPSCSGIGAQLETAFTCVNVCGMVEQCSPTRQITGAACCEYSGELPSDPGTGCSNLRQVTTSWGGASGCTPVKKAICCDNASCLDAPVPAKCECTNGTCKLRTNCKRVASFSGCQPQYADCTCGNCAADASVPSGCECIKSGDQYQGLDWNCSEEKCRRVTSFTGCTPQYTDCACSSCPANQPEPETCECTKQGTAKLPEWTCSPKAAPQECTKVASFSGCTPEYAPCVCGQCGTNASVPANCECNKGGTAEKPSWTCTEKAPEQNCQQVKSFNGCEPQYAPCTCGNCSHAPTPVGCTCKKMGNEQTGLEWECSAIAPEPEGNGGSGEVDCNSAPVNGYNDGTGFHECWKCEGGTSFVYRTSLGGWAQAYSNVADCGACNGWLSNYKGGEAGKYCKPASQTGQSDDGFFYYDEGPAAQAADVTAGCSVGHGSSTTGAWTLGLLLGLFAFLRRRR